MGELEKQSSSSETNDGLGEKGSRPRKRAALNAGRKTTKREKLKAMTDKIAASIEHMDREYTDKYGYLSKRMEFEKEEADKQRAHELMMEERREARRVLATNAMLLVSETERSLGYAC
ncbi:hypothetical protein PR003_g1020 [Phytophthora rubi]|uniref:No apical meristem-associated C-terminal domain-containing protein n=1 Tax=Phytophthora rubi TaxID=129364 RepID=A0A6A4G7N8_9STRA|nr:hypothetical protein PR002_g944 [Phytophthora rubi]KAE9051776.1 hypothetical protein PR001_g1131 [Phytophthora rubi]KAE9358905.1 hypothetical protein PR003_g1020 [Phytophthora rubi]